jgi:hypothetical protein
VEEGFPYHVFIVRCWLERGGETAVWRFTIQDNSEGNVQILDTAADLSRVIEQKLKTWEGVEGTECEER